ncbi:MAG TPA: DegV family protein [Selenomonadales bacterium]|nr:DegV family protein [Selenomonadales bacterium]
MPDIHIVLDSTAGVSPAILSAYANLHVVSLTVMLDGQEWPEEKIAPAELFAAVAAGRRHPRTSQPSPGDFARVAGPLARDGNDVIIITLSSAVSGTLQSAKTGASMVGGRVWVIDSGTTAAGMVKMAEWALEEAARGTPAEKIAGGLEARRQRTRTMFVPGTLEYLHKGGRIGGASALIGTLLQIKPVLYLVEGKVAVLDKVRTRQRAVARMVEELKRCRRPAYIGIVQIEAADEGDRLERQLRELYPDCDITVAAGGAVLGTHLGPGLLGIIYQESLEEDGA